MTLGAVFNKHRTLVKEGLHMKRSGLHSDVRFDDFSDGFYRIARGVLRPRLARHPVADHRAQRATFPSLGAGSA